MNYFERPEISNSDIKLISKSINAYLERENKTTAPMELGTATHSYILEYEKFVDDYAIMGSFNKATKAGLELCATDLSKYIKGFDESYIKDLALNSLKKDGQKEIFQNFIAENLKQTVLNLDDYDVIKAMANKLQQSKIYNKITRGKNIEIEKEIYWNYLDVPVRSKIDLINHDLKIIVDLKTIDDLSKAERRAKYDYATQSAFYRQAVLVDTGKLYDFIFMFCEKNKPNDCEFYRVNDFSEGLSKIEIALSRYKEYVANPGIYTGRGNQIIDI